jgi:NADH-quinone oxidoreductase subunit N
MFSSEAGLKYFISGSFISGIFLLGCSFVYGGLGTLRFDQISILLSLSLVDNHFLIRYFILFGIALIIVSLLFKLTAAPFHFWSPDVYDGSPLSTAIIFSIVPKLMIFTFFFKFLISLSLFFLNFKLSLFFVSIASIFFGTFFAIRQKKLKRMVIYSSIAQVGFLVAAISMVNLLGFSSFFYYLVVYAITSILIWSYITFFYYFQERTQGFYKKEIYTLFISNFSDLLKKNSVWSLAFILIFFSIAGMPPLSGFFSKFFVIFGVMDSFNVFESVFFIVISCVSVFYYLRILKIIFFEGKSSISNSNQVLILDYSASEFELTSVALWLFSLLFLFVFPNTLLLFGQYVLLNTF